MKKRGAILQDYTGKIILAIIVLAILSMAIYLWVKAGKGGLGEIFNLFKR